MPSASDAYPKGTARPALFKDRPAPAPAATGDLPQRLSAKENWRVQAGHRYTPEELQAMSQGAPVEIRRRKIVVMRY